MGDAGDAEDLEAAAVGVAVQEAAAAGAGADPAAAFDLQSSRPAGRDALRQNSAVALD